MISCTRLSTHREAGLAQSKLWPKGTLCITIAANIAETGVLGFDACFPDSVIGVVVDEGQTSSKYIEYMLGTFKAALDQLKQSMLHQAFSVRLSS